MELTSTRPGTHELGVSRRDVENKSVPRQRFGTAPGRLLRKCRNESTRGIAAEGMGQTEWFGTIQSPDYSVSGECGQTRKKV